MSPIISRNSSQIDKSTKVLPAPTLLNRTHTLRERYWGSLFTLARILLASANLPPTFHPFAIQTAAWILNRLPRPSRGNQSPYYILTKRLPDLSCLYSFGCLCTAVIPSARRDGDKHFADRGQPSLYLGPSELSPGHVIYLISARTVVTRPHIQVWEDQFPGLKGVNYVWFPVTDQSPGPEIPPSNPAIVPTAVDSNPSPSGSSPQSNDQSSSPELSSPAPIDASEAPPDSESRAAEPEPPISDEAPPVQATGSSRLLQ